MPAANTMPYKSSTWATPTQTAIGISAISANRPRSAPIMSWRRCRLRRSTRIPIGNVASRKGRNCATRSSPTSAALAESVTRASSGSASSATSEPNVDTVEANHSRRNVRLAHTFGRGCSALTCVILKEVMHNQE